MSHFVIRVVPCGHKPEVFRGNKEEWPCTCSIKRGGWIVLNEKWEPTPLESLRANMGRKEKATDATVFGTRAKAESKAFDIIGKFPAAIGRLRVTRIPFRADVRQLV